MIVLATLRERLRGSDVGCVGSACQVIDGSG